MRQVVLYPDEDGIWCALVPSLPGCFSDGKTREEAMINVREAIELYIESLRAKDEPIPEEKFETLVIVLEDAISAA